MDNEATYEADEDYVLQDGERVFFVATLDTRVSDAEWAEKIAAALNAFKDVR